MVIHTSPTINDDFDTILIKQFDKPDHILGNHFRIIHLSLISYINMPDSFQLLFTSAGVPAPEWNGHR